MKKYVKPELVFESFKLSQNIAACGIDMNHADETQCTPTLDDTFWPGLGGTHVFQANSCELDINIIESYCYTVGTSEAGRTFNS